MKSNDVNNFYGNELRKQIFLTIRLAQYLWKSLPPKCGPFNLRPVGPQYMICTDYTSYLWMLAWRWSNKTVTCCHNKILIFITCRVLTVTLKHCVLFLSKLQCVAKNFAQGNEKHHKSLPKTWPRNVLNVSNMMQMIKHEGKGKLITFVLQYNPKLLNAQSKFYGNSNHVGQVQVRLHINTLTLFTHKSCFYSSMFCKQWTLFVAGLEVCMALWNKPPMNCER